MYVSIYIYMYLFIYICTFLFINHQALNYDTHADTGKARKGSKPFARISELLVPASIVVGGLGFRALGLGFRV